VRYDADGLPLAAQVYNYDLAAAKNMIELSGTAWENKIIGSLCGPAAKAVTYR